MDKLKLEIIVPTKNLSLSKTIMIDSEGQNILEFRLSIQKQKILNSKLPN